MGLKCTVFSIGEADLATTPADDTSLPRYDELTSRMSLKGATPMIELGEAWAALHWALGDHAAEQPAGFLSAGGEAVSALDDGERSSGRYFAPSLTAKILAALVLASDRDLTARFAKTPAAVARIEPVEGLRLFDRLRGFVAQAVAANHGVVVHLFI
jgi:hypothetical protein